MARELELSAAEAAEELFYTVGVEMGMLLLLTCFMVWYFSAPGSPAAVPVVVVFGWYMGLCGTLLLPADIADVQVNGGGSVWLLYAWDIVYWSTFMVAWFIMPILYSALSAGDLTWRGRFRAAIRDNLVSYCLMALGGIIAIGYLLIKGVATPDTLSGFLMAWGNTYGLLLIVVLMGHGLVEVPRQLWVNADPHRHLKVLFFRATQIDSSLYDAIYDLEDAEKELARLQRVAATGRDDVSRDSARITRHLEAVQATRDRFDLVAMAPDRASHSQTSRTSGGAVDSPSVNAKAAKPDKRGLVGEIIRLHGKLRNGQERVVAGRQRWEVLLKEVAMVQLLISRELPRPQSQTAGRDANICRRFGTFLALKYARCVWIWRLYIKRTVLRITALLCGILTLLVLWSEVSLGAPEGLSPFGAIAQAMEGSNPVVIQAGALIPFLYMSICCYRSLFKLKLFGSLALHGPHMSLPGQLVFNAQYLSRLQFPLGYNYLQLLRYDSDKLHYMAFNKLMANMAVVPLFGSDFNTYAPIIMVVLCLFTACHGYARLLKMIGVEHEDLASGGDVEGQARCEEGKTLIERAMRQAAQRDLRRAGAASNGTGFSAKRDVASLNIDSASSPTFSPTPTSFSPQPTMGSYRTYGRVNDNL